jgi:hypothetical protein
LNLKVKQGGNQKGFCFVSTEVPELENGVCEIGNNSGKILADVRKSTKVTKDTIFLDSRIFSLLTCTEGSDVSVVPLGLDIPTCRTLELTVTSMKGLDNRAISEAISKRINDLIDDFEGFVLQENQRLLVTHLGIQFSVKSLEPMNDRSKSCRIKWDKLERIHLEPVSSMSPYNLICVVEVGAAAHISDVLQNASQSEAKLVSRYATALRVLNHILSRYSGYGTDTKFSGFAYSDEIAAYSVFDPETGTLIEMTSLYSKSVIEAFIEWVDKVVQTHKSRPSNPGLALTATIERASEISEENDFPTIILLCSSGVHSSGPNPVKAVKKGIELVQVPVICISLGSESNVDVLKTIADITNGLIIEISDTDEIVMINDTLAEWFQRRRGAI